MIPQTPWDVCILVDHYSVPHLTEAISALAANPGITVEAGGHRFTIPTGDPIRLAYEVIAGIGALISATLGLRKIFNQSLDDKRKYEGLWHVIIEWDQDWARHNLLKGSTEYLVSDGEVEADYSGSEARASAGKDSHRTPL